MIQYFIKFKDSFKNFIKREPLYLWLLIFIVLINLLTLLPIPKEEEELLPKLSRAEMLMKQQDKLKSAIMEDKRASTIAALVTMGVALFILIGLILDFVIFIRKTGKAVLLERSLSLPRVNWDVWDALKVAILFFFFGYVLLLIEALLIAPFFPAIKDNETTVSIINTTILDLIAVTVVLYFVIHRYKHKLNDLGLTLKNFFKNIYYGIFGYISALPVLIVSLLITIFFVNLIKYEPKPQPVMNMFLEEEKTVVLFHLSLFVAIVGPIIEEIFFRGFLYNALRKMTGIKWAIFISALLFSFLHAHVVGFLPILVLGMFLAYLYEKTGSLIPSITVHVIHNVAMVCIVFLIKGIKF